MVEKQSSKGAPARPRIGDGAMLVRKWFSGEGGSNIHVLSGEEGDTILMHAETGLARLRLSTTTE